MSRRIALSLVLVMLLGVGLACSSSTSNDLSAAAVASTKEAGQSAAKPATTATPQSTKNAETVPTTVPTEPVPTQVPTLAPEALKVSEIQGFVQDDIHLISVFMVENPNQDQAIERSEYQVAIYDEAGTVLKTDSGYLTLILPGEKTALIAESYLEKGQKAAKVEIQVNSGDASSLDLNAAPYSVDQIKFLPDNYFPKVTGVIKNGLNRNISEMRVAAVAYDKSGVIIGGGYTYLSFLPASGQAPVDISMVVKGNPDKVEIYPGLSGLSDFEEATIGDDVVHLVSYGFGQSSSQVAVAFIVENPQSGTPLEGTQYQVGIYDEAGNVLDTESGYVNLIFPGEKQAVVASAFVPDGKKAVKVDVQINPGRSVTHELSATPFTTDQVKFTPGSYTAKVTGVVQNTLDKQVKQVEVVAVAYNEQGEIIGGGYTYLDFVPANAKSAVEVSVTVTGKPAKVELYPSLTSMSEIE
ncbi:MAG: FxLYD domain-containing protein [Anaerolineaceae bacterium]|nr:FxLYD domain-containing protein [Anaerolineaceae bacterium]